MSGRLDIILLLSNVHFPLKSKEFLSRIIYMEMILLLAEKQEKELFTVSFKIEEEIKKAYTDVIFILCALWRLPHLCTLNLPLLWWEIGPRISGTYKKPPSLYTQQASRRHDPPQSFPVSKMLVPPPNNFTKRHHWDSRNTLQTCLRPCSPISWLWEAARYRGKGLDLTGQAHCAQMCCATLGRWLTLSEPHWSPG